MTEAAPGTAKSATPSGPGHPDRPANTEDPLAAVVTGWISEPLLDPHRDDARLAYLCDSWGNTFRLSGTSNSECR